MQKSPCLVSLLLVRTLIKSMVFSCTLLLQTEWWYQIVKGEIICVMSCSQSSLQWIRKRVANWLGSTAQVCSARCHWVSQWPSASFILSAAEQGSKHANHDCVISCFEKVNLLDCLTQKFDRILVAFLKRFVVIDCVGVFIYSFRKELISGYLPEMSFNPNFTNLTLVLVASIDGEHIALCI